MKYRKGKIRQNVHLVENDQNIFCIVSQLTPRKRMTEKQKIEIRKQFGAFLKKHREEVLKVKNLLEFSYGTSLDNSKLGKIEKGQVNFTFDTLVEIQKAYQLRSNVIFGFGIKLIE